MNWETSGFEEEDSNGNKLDSSLCSQQKEILEKNTEQKVVQLQRYADPTKDPIRQFYFNMMTQFTDLLLQNKTQDIIDSLLEEDCQTFLFCSRTERTPTQYATKAKDFAKLYEDIDILTIRVRETSADLEKHTAFQICNYEVSYGNDTIMNEIVVNIFTFKDKKICKLRVLFAHKTMMHGSEDFLAPTKRDRMFAKVKEINYAIAGHQPDFKKVASLFSENTMYRIWRWDDFKCFVFSKQDLVEKFKDLEEDYTIRSIIPYEITFDREFVVGTYGYELEKKYTEQRCIWYSTCIYAFDEHVNLIKISQQGELFPEEDAINPFELYPKDVLNQNIKQLFTNVKLNLDWFYNDLVQSTVDLCRIVPEAFPQVAPVHHGIEHVANFFNAIKSKDINIEWLRLVDTFIDQHEPSYDSAFVMLCGQGSFFFDTYKHKGKRMNYFSFCKVGFEKGRVIKILQCLFEVPEPILSPFDNPYFSAINIKREDPQKKETV